MGKFTIWVLAAFLASIYAACLVSADHLDTGARIINGTLANQNATMHQVSIRRKLNDGYFFGTGHICGGSLIAKNVVMSANHCFLDQKLYDGTLLPPEDFIVVMGNLDRFERNNSITFDVVKIEYMVPVFNVSTYEHDIALIFLNDSVPDSMTHIKPMNFSQVPVEPGTICQVTGWGTTEDGYLSDYLMTVDVPVIPHGVCAAESLFAPEQIGDGMMCAGYLEQGEKDACGGDSGGPMVCNGVVAGIVSWGSGCAKPLLPGIYTNVYYYNPWIKMIFIDNNIPYPGKGSAAGLKCSLIMMGILLVISLVFGKNIC